MRRHLLTIRIGILFCITGGTWDSTNNRGMLCTSAWRAWLQQGPKEVLTHWTLIVKRFRCSKRKVWSTICWQQLIKSLSMVWGNFSPCFGKKYKIGVTWVSMTYGWSHTPYGWKIVTTMSQQRKKQNNLQCIGSRYCINSKRPSYSNSRRRQSM